MPLTQADLDAIAGLLNRGTAPGQKDWPGTEVAELVTEQGLVNAVAAVSAALSGIKGMLDGIKTEADAIKVELDAIHAGGSADLAPAITRLDNISAALARGFKVTEA